jgi:hypothetical protein
MNDCTKNISWHIIICFLYFKVDLSKVLIFNNCNEGESNNSIGIKLKSLIINAQVEYEVLFLEVFLKIPKLTTKISKVNVIEPSAKKKKNIL